MRWLTAELVYNDKISVISGNVSFKKPEIVFADGEDELILVAKPDVTTVVSQNIRLKIMFLCFPVSPLLDFHYEMKSAKK